MKDIEQRAEEMAKATYRDNPNDLKKEGYQYNTDLNAPRKRSAFIKGYLAGMTEERERGKRFANWVRCKYYGWGDGDKWIEILFGDPEIFYTTDELFNEFLSEEK